MLNKQKTLAELKDAAKRYRALQSVRTAFCRCTNTTWEQACERFPLYTSEQQLSQFLSLSFKNIPDSFVSYCQAALQKEHESSSMQSLDVYSYQGVTAYALQHDILSVSYSDIRESGAVFNGAHLFIAHIPQVCTCTFVYHIQYTEVKCNACLNLNKFMQNWTTDDVQRLAYTSRQLNTLPEHPLMLFNCVIICTAEQMESVAKSLQQCFNHTEFGYWHNQACSTSGKSPF